MAPRSRTMRTVSASDMLRTALGALVTRRLRGTLSSLGIAIGIASMVAVLGISESSRADLIATLDRLGTNLLTVTPGRSLFGADSELPSSAVAMTERIGPVEEVSAVRNISASVRRSDLISELQTSGIRLVAADTDLLETLGGSVASGRFLDAATARYPAVVLGSVAAERLGIGGLAGDVRVWIDDRWFSVVGILDALPLAPDLERSALVGKPAARRYLDGGGAASALYVRAHPDAVADVRAVLAATVNPLRPEEVEVERPSDALEARAAAKAAFTGLLLGLGAVALVVSAIGIANVMVISVLERRSEIGLRRALGATKGHLRVQFLTEAVAVAVLGGVGGAAVGTIATYLYSSQRGWQPTVPVEALAGAVGIAVLVGALAGLYPAMRAARLSPTDALRTS
ncbi:MAG TPA: ABC transporter permease [Actinomycetota bacterium]|nr:ABC transporter permease [Actinomycetota bacterium]